MCFGNPSELYCILRTLVIVPATETKYSFISSPRELRSSPGMA